MVSAELSCRTFVAGVARRRSSRTRSLVATWFFLALLLLVSRPCAATTLIVDDHFEEQPIGRALELFYDPTGTRTVSEMSAGDLPFSPSTKEVPTFGFRNGAEWARFSLRDTRSDRHDSLILSYSYASADFVDVSCVISVDGKEHVEAFHAGDHVPHGAWPIRSRLPSFRLPAGTRDVFLRVAGSSSHQLAFGLGTERAHERALSRETAVLAAYYGALGAMFLYNMLVWLSVGLALYGYYVAFLASYGITSLVLNGWIYSVFLERASWLNDHLAVVSIAALGATSTAFTSQLLDFGPHRGTFVTVAKGLFATVVGWGGLSLVLPYAIGMKGVLGLAVIWFCFLITAGVVAARRGEVAGRLFLLAWSAFLAGTIVNTLRAFGALPSNNWTSTNVQLIGSALEFLLLSFALADRIKRLQAEATENAELAAKNAVAAEEASTRALAEQERANTELQRLDRLKDEFLANTSHELRTPLHGILGLTEAVLASDAGVSSVSRERLGMVVASGRRLSSLVNDILDFSKLRHQAIALREKSFAMREAVGLATSVVAPMAASKALALVNEVPPEVNVRADENRVQQILTNLIGNAVKFTNSGSVSIRSWADGERVFVAITDSGIGIPEEAHERIFASFEQADGSTSRDYGGTGLGLAVTRQLVELHGGAIRVESTPGHGSTFTFDLPRSATLAVDSHADPMDSDDGRGSVLVRSASVVVASSDFGDLPRQDVPTSISQHVPRAGHVLIADDDPVNVEVLRAQLEPAGYAVSTAKDGAEAVELLASLDDVDGVLLDVMMPKMTGIQAAAKIREAHPHGTLPILMLTAKSRAEDAVVGMRAGASDYIGKPFHREELLQRVDAHVQSVKTARAFRRFVPADFLGLLGVERFDALRAGIGQQHEVTILFTDVRNFTTRSEMLGPEGIFRFINGCLERFEPVVRQHGGFVDKFIGDAVMAIFPGDPLDAARAAEGLQREVSLFNTARPDAKMPLAIGVGVHLGRVILGTVGGPDRMEVTAIGDAVNVAARLESLTKGLGAGAVVSEEVLNGKPHDARRVGAVHVKGRAAPVELFELLACCSSGLEREQKLATTERFQRGLRAYAQGDMARAREHFANCAAAAPLDRTAAIYLERSTAYAERGVPEGFDGCLDGL